MPQRRRRPPSASARKTTSPYSPHSPWGRRRIHHQARHTNAVAIARLSALASAGRRCRDQVTSSLPVIRPRQTGRIVPLSKRAVAALSFWASHFPDRKPEHYVFPAERYGAGGDEFSPKAYHIDPTKPIGSIKEAWEAARLRAAKILVGETKRWKWGR